MFDEDEQEFLDALKSGTRKVYKPGLEAFLNFYQQMGYGESLSDFLDAVEQDIRLPRRERKRFARNVFNEFVKFLVEKGFKPKSIRTYVSAVQSFAGYYDIKLSTRYVNLPTSNPVSHKFPWSLEKVAEFVELIKSPTVRSVAVTIFQSGLGLADALALTYGDIKYEYENGIVPLCLDLARIKTDVPFMTFIGKWGVDCLKKSLEGRNLTLDTPLYPVTDRTVEIHFKKLAKKWLGDYEGRNPMRPHSLRAAFRTILGDARCDRDVVEFWMGHKLPEQQRVYQSRTRDGWRALYQKYEKYLTPSGV